MHDLALASCTTALVALAQPISRERTRLKERQLGHTYQRRKLVGLVTSLADRSFACQILREHLELHLHSPSIFARCIWVRQVGLVRITVAKAAALLCALSRLRGCECDLILRSASGKARSASGPSRKPNSSPRKSLGAKRQQEVLQIAQILRVALDAMVLRESDVCSSELRLDLFR